MLKLTERNIPGYLEDLGVLGEVDWGKVVVSEVTEYTNVNYVFSLELPAGKHRKLFIKQAFDYVKIAPDFPAPIGRQKCEELSIEYLQKYWKGRIPEVIHYDGENNILIITDVGKGAVLLAEEFKNSRLHFEIGEDLGLMMSELHAPTFDESTYPVRDEKENQEHVEFIFDFRLRGSREVIPDETQEIFDESIKVKSSVIYGDWASKNVFVAGDKVRLVDFENLVRFDPAFDIGYALAHWVLDVSETNQSDMIGFFENFENAYEKGWKKDFEEDVQQIIRRAARYLGAMMLHRLAGVKNTNRMEEYLARGIPLIDIAKGFVKEGYDSPSKAVASLKL